jgi:nucleotide-binding universal stress UspA family protein
MTMRKNRIERIVVGLDGSDQSRVAFEWAMRTGGAREPVAAAQEKA